MSDWPASDWNVDPLQREQSYGDALSALLPKSTNVPPNLIAPGMSSISKDGTAAGSVDRADPDDQRAKAWQAYSQAANRVNQAYAQPAPQLQSPKYSLVEAGLGTLLGGLLNRASPYTSEGTKALNAYIGVKDRDTLTDYQNEAAQHAQNVQAALQNYRMTESAAEEQLQQANAQDQRQSTADQQSGEQAFAQRMQAERLASQQYEGALERDAQSYLEQQRQQGQQLHDQQVQRLLANQVGINLMSKTSHGRWLLGYRDAVGNGLSPDKAAEQANAWALELPDETAKRLHDQLLQEETETAKIDPNSSLSVKQLGSARSALNGPTPQKMKNASPLNRFLLNLGLEPLSP